MTFKGANSRPVGTVRIGTPVLVGVILLASAPAAVAAVLMNSDGPTRQSTRNYTSGALVEHLIVVGDHGDVHVIGDPGITTASVTAILQWSSGPAPKVSQVLTGSTYAVGYTCGDGGMSGCGVIFTIHVQAEAAVDVTTTDGMVSASAVSGALTLATTNGDITGTNLGAGNASLKTTNGVVNVQFDGDPLAIAANTTNGDIDVRTSGKLKYYDVVTVANGNIHPDNVQDRFSTHVVTATTVSGNVTVK